MNRVDTPATHAPAGELVLGRYRLARRLGAGGMGVVYAARDEHLERDVAVKRISVELDPDGRGEREALAAARLSHPGIVALYESGRDEQAVYLVSELVVGRTLAELERTGDLSDRDVARIGITLCAALQHAHSRGVIHRDVKPSNIIVPDRVDEDEAGGVAKLTDFGIARMADGDVLTRTGDIIGTLAYMAPEQARGQKLTGAADVYALGVVLYEALTGVNPIRAGNPAATARRVGSRLPALQRVRRDLPPELCRVIDAAVQPDPGARASLGVLRRALIAAVDEVADDAGPIAGPSERGLALTATRRALAEATQHYRSRYGATDLTTASAARVDRAGDRAERRVGPTGVPVTTRAPARERLNLAPPARIAAAAGAAGLTAMALSWIGPEPHASAASAAMGACAAAVVVALLPRLGWLLTVLALALWLGVEAPGAALLVLLAAGPVPVLLAHRPAAWSAPQIAPLLGALGIAGAWPALAGQASAWQARAALGALGGWWLALAEMLGDERLLGGAPHEVPPAAQWDGSAIDAAHDALLPLLTSGAALGLAALWAVGALVLPLLVRGRWVGIDIVAASGWAAALAAGTQAIAQTAGLAAPRGLVAGAIVAALAAIAARAVRGRA